MEQTAVLSIFCVEPSQYFFQLALPPAPGDQLGLHIRPPWSLVGTTRLDAALRSQLEEAIDNAVAYLHLSHPTTTQATSGAQATETDPLEHLGKLLFRLLLPTPVQTALNQLPDQLPLLLATYNTELPWELFHNGEQYLALKHAIGRQLLSLRPPQPKPFGPDQTRRRFLFIANPQGDLSEADLEVEQLINLCDAVADDNGPDAGLLVGDRVRKPAILGALTSGYDLIHYSGHAKAGALLLADGELTAEEIRNLLSGRPFIFLNACWSVRETAPLEKPAELPYAGLAARNLASAFILGGAAAVIGTLWPVRDSGARKFAKKFYTLALAGATVGEALRQARRWVQKDYPNDPLWAAFILYGDPTFRLETPKRHSIQPVTTLAVRFFNLLQLFNTLPLDRAAEIKEHILDRLAQVAQHFGGQVDSSVADVLYVHFGAVEVHQDDAERAIQTALSMMSALQTLLQPQEMRPPIVLALQVGVSSGSVVVRQVSLPTGTTYQITGQVAEVAARLAAQAKSGQILTDEPTYQLAKSAIAFQPVASPPIAADIVSFLTYQVIPDKKPQEAGPEYPLIGREEEIKRLGDWWREAASGEGGLVSIMAAAGVGKTRLIQAFRETLPDQKHQWLQVTCKSYEQTDPYALLAQLISLLAQIKSSDDEATRRSKLLGLLRDLGPLTEEQIADNLALLGEAVDLSFAVPTVTNLEPESRQGRLADLVWAVLTMRGQQQPAVIVLEDLHWADEASLAVLDQMGLVATDMRVLLLVTHRPEFSVKWGGQWEYRNSITLRELRPEGRQTFLALLLNTSALPGGVSEAILSLTGGNPFWIKEVVNALQVQNILIQEAGQWRLTRPPSEVLPNKIISAILSYLERLNTASRRVLETASVLGERFEQQTLAAVLPEALSENLNHHLKDLSRQKLLQQTEGLFPNITYAFPHGLMHQIVYESLLPRDQRAAHGYVARALRKRHQADEERILELIAYHYRRSDDVVNAIDYAIRAAAHAAAAWANETALDWYNWVLETLDSFADRQIAGVVGQAGVPPDQRLLWRAEALEGRASVQAVVGHNDEAIADYTQVLDLMAEVKQFPVTHQADIYHKLARVHDPKGAFEAAQAMAQRGLEILAGRVCLEAGRLHIWIGMLHYRQGKLAEAMAASEQAIRVIKQTQATAEQLNGTRDLAQAYMLHGLFQAFSGHHHAARSDIEESISLYKAANYLPGLARACSKLGFIAQNLGQWDEALSHYQESERLSQKIREPLSQTVALIDRGEIYIRQGKLDQTISVNEGARHLAEAFNFAEFFWF